MNYILIGALAFLIGYSFELATVKRVPGAKPLVGVVTGGLLVYSTIMVCLTSERLSLPGWLQGVGWVLLPPSAFLLVYSLFLELPFSGTYRARGPGPHLVTTGTYALVRHSSVLWYALVLASLLFLFEAKLLLLALPIWVSLDVLWAVIQERLLLSKAFPDYDSYRHTTPMLIPNWRSLSVCLRSLRQAQLQGR